MTSVLSGKAAWTADQRLKSQYHGARAAGAIGRVYLVRALTGSLTFSKLSISTLPGRPSTFSTRRT